MEKSTQIIDAYIRFKSNPENDDKRDTHFAQMMGIALDELKAVKKKNSSWGAAALKIRRALYAEEMARVDKMLFEAAKSGDTKAADLLYRRFDGWNPRVVEQTNNFYNFAELVKGLKKSEKKATYIKRDL